MKQDIASYSKQLNYQPSHLFHARKEKITQRKLNNTTVVELKHTSEASNVTINQINHLVDSHCI